MNIFKAFYNQKLKLCNKIRGESALKKFSNIEKFLLNLSQDAAITNTTIKRKKIESKVRIICYIIITGFKNYF